MLVHRTVPSHFLALLIFFPIPCNRLGISPKSPNSVSRIPSQSTSDADNVATTGLATQLPFPFSTIYSVRFTFRCKILGSSPLTASGTSTVSQHLSSRSLPFLLNTPPKSPNLSFPPFPSLLGGLLGATPAGSTLRSELVCSRYKLFPGVGPSLFITGLLLCAAGTTSTRCPEMLYAPFLPGDFLWWRGARGGAPAELVCLWRASRLYMLEPRAASPSKSSGSGVVGVSAPGAWLPGSHAEDDEPGGVSECSPGNSWSSSLRDLISSAFADPAVEGADVAYLCEP